MASSAFDTRLARSAREPRRSPPRPLSASARAPPRPAGRSSPRSFPHPSPRSLAPRSRSRSRSTSKRASGTTRSTTSSTAALSGGGVMGCGRFACFYSPVLPLAGWTVPHSDIGQVPVAFPPGAAERAALEAGCKLGQYEDLLTEYASGLKLTVLDPDARFGVYVKGVSRLKPGYDGDATVAASADSRFPLAQRATGVAYEENGGIALAATISPESYNGGIARDIPAAARALSAAEIVAGLKNLWAGLVLFHGAGLGHGDLHLSNVVRDKDAGWRFIDFAPLSTDASLLMQAQTRDVAALQHITMDCVKFFLRSATGVGKAAPKSALQRGDANPRATSAAGAAAAATGAGGDGSAGSAVAGVTGLPEKPDVSLHVVNSMFVFAPPKTSELAEEACALVDRLVGRSLLEKTRRAHV